MVAISLPPANLLNRSAVNRKDFGESWRLDVAIQLTGSLFWIAPQIQRFDSGPMVF